LWKGN